MPPQSGKSDSGDGSYTTWRGSASGTSYSWRVCLGATAAVRFVSASQPHARDVLNEYTPPSTCTPSQRIEYQHPPSS